MKKSSLIGEYNINKKVCDSLINFFKKNSNYHRVGTVKYTKNFNEKKSTDLVLDISLDFDEIKNYKNELFKCIEKYKKDYIYCDKNQSYWGIVETFNIQKYKPKEGFFAFHYENVGNAVSIKRHLVFMTYLNNVPGEGGTEFFYQKKKFKAKKGKTLIWPAQWTHTHKGIISNKYTKYIATGWLSYIDNN